MNAVKSHAHRWEPIRKGFPQRICRCGAIGAASLQAGKNTLTMSPTGVGDLVRWSATQNAVAAGDVGMNTVNGRPQLFVDGVARSMPSLQEGGGPLWRWRVQHNPALTSLSTVGIAASPTVNGTPSVHDVSDFEGVDYATAAVVNSDGGWISGTFDLTKTDRFPILDVVMKTGASIANVRIWVGLFSADPMASADPALHLAGMRFDTGAGDANWQLVTNDGVGGGTVTNTGVAVVANQVDWVRIVRLANGNIALRLNDGPIVATNSTNLPTTSQALGYNVQVRTLAAASKSIRISHMQLTSRYPSQ